MHEVAVKYPTLGTLYQAIDYCFITFDKNNWHAVNEYNAERIDFVVWENVLKTHSGFNNVMLLFGNSIMVYNTTFCFNNKDDALHFKLVFGGNN